MTQASLRAVDCERDLEHGESGGSVAKIDPIPTQQHRLCDPVNVEIARVVNNWLNRQPIGSKGLLAAKLGVNERTLESWLYLSKPWPTPAAFRVLGHCVESDGSLAALNVVLELVGATGARRAGGEATLAPLKVKLAKVQHTIASAELDGIVDHNERRAIRADLRDVVAMAGGFLDEDGGQ